MINKDRLADTFRMLAEIDSISKEEAGISKKIGEILAKKFGPEIEPIYERLGKFLIQMHKEKFIRLDCPSN